MKAASTATRALDPSAQFLIESEMQAHLNGVWTWWVNDLYKAMPSLNRYFYEVAVTTTRPTSEPPHRSPYVGPSPRRTRVQQC